MVTTGRSYSLLSSVVSVLAFNFFFTDPFFTLRSDPSYIATFGIMFIVGLLSSSLTTRVKLQAKMNADKAYRTAILLESSHKSVSYTHLDVYKRQVHDFFALGRVNAVAGLHPGADGIGGALADLTALIVHAAHAGLGGEWNEGHVLVAQLPAAEVEFFFG